MSLLFSAPMSLVFYISTVKDIFFSLDCRLHVAHMCTYRVVRAGAAWQCQ